MPTSFPRLWIALAVLWCAGLSYYLTIPYLPHDVSWVLLATGRMLDGARIYRDIIEINPPLIFYSAVPAVLAAKLGGWPVMPSFIIYVFALILVSLVLTARVMAEAAVLSARAQGWMTLAGFIALSLLPLTDFGQREHFTAILTLPYVTLLAGRFAGRGCGPVPALLAGLLAGVGFAFKPFFLVVPAALELYLILRHRSMLAAFRAETIAAALVIGGYAALVLLAHPDYAGHIVPFGLLVYGAYAKPLAYALLQPDLPAFLLPVCAYLLARLVGRGGGYLDAFAIAAGGFFIAYLVQAKGWSYHLIPVAVFLWMGAAAVPSLHRAPAGRSGPTRRIPLATAVAALAFMALAPALRGPACSPIADSLAPLVRDIAPGGSLYAFTSHVWVAFPLVPAAGLEWASRFPTQWLLPGVINRLRTADDAALRRRLETVGRYTIDAVNDDLQQGRPDIVVVDLDNPYFDERGFDYLGYFERDARFRRLWQDYAKVDQVSFMENVSPTELGSFDIRRERRFDVYCRRGAAPGCDRLASRASEPPQARPGSMMSAVGTPAGSAALR